MPSAFIPTEDKGFFVLAIQLPDAASLQRTEEVVEQVEAIRAGGAGGGDVVALVGLDLLTYSNQTNSATMFVAAQTVGRAAARTQQLDAIAGRVNGQLFGLKDAVAFGFNFPEIPGLGATAGLEVNLQARSGPGLPAIRRRGAARSSQDAERAARSCRARPR